MNTPIYYYYETNPGNPFSRKMILLIFPSGKTHALINDGKRDTFHPFTDSPLMQSLMNSKEISSKKVKNEEKLKDIIPSLEEGRPLSLELVSELFLPVS